MSKLKKVKDVLDAIGKTKTGQKVTKKVKEAGEFVGIRDKRKKNVKAGVARVEKAKEVGGKAAPFAVPGVITAAGITGAALSGDEKKPGTASASTVSTSQKPKENKTTTNKSQNQTNKTNQDTGSGQIRGKQTSDRNKVADTSGSKDTLKKPNKADMSDFKKKYAEARKKYKAGGATKFSFKGRQYSVATKSELEKAGGYGKVDSYLKSKQAKSKSSGGVIKKSVGGTVRGMGAATRGGNFRVR